MYRLGWIILLLFFYVKHIRFDPNEYYAMGYNNYLTKDLIWRI